MICVAGGAARGAGGGGGGDGGGASGDSGAAESLAASAASGSIMSAVARATAERSSLQSSAALPSSRIPRISPSARRSTTTACQSKGCPERSARASIERSASAGETIAWRPSRSSTALAIAGAPPQPSAPGSSTQLRAEVRCESATAADDREHSAPRQPRATSKRFATEPDFISSPGARGARHDKALTSSVPSEEGAPSSPRARGQAVLGSIAPGYHVMSDRPSDPSYIATRVHFEDSGRVSWKEPRYPPSVSIQLDQTSIATFQGETMVSIPFVVATDTGDASGRFDGTVRY